MITDETDFTYEDDTHEYRNSAGEVCPSVTQLLKTNGIFDYSMVMPSVLENAARRGKNVHRWTEEFDRYGDVDPTWMQDDEIPYFEAWKKFRRESGFIIREMETPILRNISGVDVGGTPDRVGLLGAQRFVIDIKTCASPHPGWALQLALYEFLITRRERVGHLGRMVVMLKRNGSYRTIPFNDSTDGICALHIVQKIASERAVSAWMSNNGLKQAA